MAKWRPQLDLTCQIGAETQLTRFLIVVERGITGGEDVRAEFFALRLWGYSGHPCNNQQSYGQMDIAFGFGRSERSI